MTEIPEITLEVQPAAIIKAPVDTTLTISGMAADAKAAGDLIRQNTASIASLEESDADKVPKPETSPNGTLGQLLQTNGDGTTSWVTQGTPTDAQVADAVGDWLEDHPEVTTTVQDGVISWDKLAPALKLAAETIPGTTQKCVFTSAGVIQQIVHEGEGGAAVRTDVFTITDATITETRTLATGQKLILVTTLATKQTSIVYSES